MAGNDPRLVQLLRIQNRRRNKAGVDTNFPKNSGKPPVFKPRKQGTVASFKPDKRARY
jgi:hypothetical protein